jgi:hypothetical protein
MVTTSTTLLPSPVLGMVHIVDGHCRQGHCSSLCQHPFLVLINPHIQIPDITPHFLSTLDNRQLTGPDQTPEGVRASSQVNSGRIEVIESLL